MRESFLEYQKSGTPWSHYEALKAVQVDVGESETQQYILISDINDHSISNVYRYEFCEDGSLSLYLLEGEEYEKAMALL